MKTLREKLLILVLPSLLVVMVYVNWIASPLQSDVQKANAELRALQAKVGSPALLIHKTARLGQLSDEAKQIQEKKAELERQWKAVACLDDTRRSEKIEELAELLKRHGLSVIEQAQETGKEGTVPAALDAVTKRMGDRRPQVWRFRVQGTYAAMLRVLSQLTYGEPAVTPLGVTMKEAPLYGDSREWTLLVWI